MRTQLPWSGVLEARERSSPQTSCLWTPPRAVVPSWKGPTGYRHLGEFRQPSRAAPNPQCIPRAYRARDGGTRQELQTLSPDPAVLLRRFWMLQKFKIRNLKLQRNYALCRFPHLPAQWLARMGSVILLQGKE